MQLKSTTESRASGFKTFINGDSFDIQDGSPSPSDTVERLLDMPEGEEVAADGVAVLRRLFEVLARDVDMAGKRGPQTLTRRVLALGHRCGALKDYSLKELAAATGPCTRQALAQAADVAEKSLGRKFARER